MKKMSVEPKKKEDFEAREAGEAEVSALPHATPTQEMTGDERPKKKRVLVKEKTKSIFNLGNMSEEGKKKNQLALTWAPPKKNVE